MLEPALLLFVVLAHHSAVYVKGHSRAAAQARERLQALTCYDPASRRGLHWRWIISSAGPAIAAW
jgi:hypothetical protein